MLLKVVVRAIAAKQARTHRFALDDVMNAYDTFGNAAKEGALKVILKNQRSSLMNRVQALPLTGQNRVRVQLLNI